MVLNFEDFVNEKMGVLMRVNQDNDALGISNIVNSFMDNILKNPDDDYSRYVLIFNNSVEIKYTPKSLTYKGPVGIAISDDKIIIFQKIFNDNYLEVKYYLIHEIVHIIQKISSSIDYKKLSLADGIKYLMVKPSIDELTSDNPNLMFTYLIYREQLGEIYAWSNNAYEKAFQYKKSNPHCQNQDVVKHVLKELSMTKDVFNMALQDVYKDDSIFRLIISILVGNFSELSDIKSQSYFDKSIFKLPIILKMRKQLANILHNNNDVENIVNDIMAMIEDNIFDLEDYKKEIVDSFVKHVKYWFEKIQTKLGKAIQLGIDDVTNDNHNV